MTSLQDAYVFDSGPIVPAYVYDITVPIPVPVIAGYDTRSDLTPLFVRSHRAEEHRVWNWLADKAELIGTILILIALVVVPGILPIFI